MAPTHLVKKTASQGNYDVSYCTFQGSYTSLSTPPALGAATSKESHTAGSIYTKIPSSRQVSDCGTSCQRN